MEELKTPEDLMKSRYEAYVRMDGEYLAKTTTQDISSDMSAYTEIEWLRLDVIEAVGDEVEFKAYYRQNEKIYLLHERSTFIKKDGVWLYDSGELFSTKIQRNEQCPCGSGRKYKKCCA